MFTGIVESMGTLATVETVGEGGVIAFEEGSLPGDLLPGDSLAVSGVCLTAEMVDGGLIFSLSPETLARTNMGTLEPGDRLNLERSLPADGRLGGHFVTGHVDGVGALESLVEQGDFVLATFSVPKTLVPFLVDKGSICVDGVSLTLVDPADDRFSTALVPETLKRTTLGLLTTGDSVHIEADILAKHVHSFLKSRGD